MLISYIQIYLLTSFFQPQSGIKVNIEGLRNSDGKVILCLYKKEAAKNFPDEAEYAFQVAESKALKSGVSIRFNNVPPGTYAISMLHDEDNDNEMDRNFVRMPREGFGTSNNVKPMMSAPSFKDARFRYQGGKQELTITVIYW